MSERSSGSSIGKWIAGITATIIGAVVIWWLTHPSGPLNPVPPTPRPKAILKIIDFAVTDAYVGESATATLTIYNEGETTGEGCSVWWYSGSEEGKRLEQGLLAQKAAVSDEFGLRPEESKQISMRSLVYTEPGRFRSYIEVSCWGYDVTSEEYYRYVNVLQP